MWPWGWLGSMRECACRDGGAPHHGADDSGDVDGVVAAGHVGGRVVLVTGASVQDGEANVQDVLLKLSPERLRLEARASTIFQTLPQPSPSQSPCRGVCLPLTPETPQSIPKSRKSLLRGPPWDQPSPCPLLLSAPWLPAPTASSVTLGLPSRRPTGIGVWFSWLSQLHVS